MTLGQREHIYFAPALSGVSHQLTVRDANVVQDGWSPDGNSLFFSDVTSTSEESVIRRVDLKTMQEETVPESRGHIGASVSPDGKYLAATKVDGQKLLLFNIATQKWTESAHVSVNALRWSRDSQFVYFDTPSSAEPAIYRLRISDRKVEAVTSLKDIRRVILPFGAWMGLTPDGSPLLMRDTGTQEVYALDFEEP